MEKRVIFFSDKTFCYMWIYSCSLSADIYANITKKNLPYSYIIRMSVISGYINETEQKMLNNVSTFLS